MNIGAHTLTHCYVASANADYIFQGNMIDALAEQNLTVLQKNIASQVSVASPPLKNAFNHVNGTGKRHLAVFMDSNCGSCTLPLNLSMTTIKHHEI